MIEALIISVDEPQLERCLGSVYEQTIPFSKVIHINDSSIPCHEGYNRGITMLLDEWFLLVNGDVILKNYAVEKCKEVIEGEIDEKVIAHLFGVKDVFMDAPLMGGIGLFKTSVLKSYPYPNRLDADRQMGKKLDSHGWIMRQHRETILATHFDSPDEFQVFRKFYVSGMKYDSRVVSQMINDLEKLSKRTRNSLYLLAMEAMNFGIGKKGYPGSKNVEYEKKMYEEFNAIQKKRASQ